MKILLRIFVVFSFMAFGVAVYGDEAYLPNADAEKSFDSDVLRDGLEASRDRATAVLTDAQNIYRICSSRPQRLLPSNGFKQERTSCKQSSSFSHKSIKNRLSCKWVIRITLPIRTVVSCDYYVFALRRLLC